MKQTFEEALNAHLLSASRVVEHARELNEERRTMTRVPMMARETREAMTTAFKKGDAVLVVTRARELASRLERVSYAATTVRSVHRNGNLYLEREPGKQVRESYGNIVLDTPVMRALLDAQIATYQSVQKAQLHACRIEVGGTQLRRVLQERREAVASELVNELWQMVERLDAMRSELETKS